MGDMAWVTIYVFPESRVLIYLRYGGGTEMLRDGDKDGVWKLLKAGMRFVSCKTMPFMFNMSAESPSSMSMSHGSHITPDTYRE